MYFSYNALQLIYRRRFYSSLQAQLNYTFSKNIDITATSDPAGGTDVRDFFNRNADKGISVNDLIHNIKYDVIYELPFGPGKRFANSLPGWLGNAIGGWQLSAIGEVYSGSGLTPYFGNINSGFQSNTRPDMVPGQVISHDLTKTGEVRRDASGQLYYFAQDDFTGLFQRPELGTLGNAPQMWMRGPGGWTLDLGLSKNFKVTEKASMQFRGEFFNAFNHMNPGDPNQDLDSSNFGRITGGSGGRVIQLAAKLYF